MAGQTRVAVIRADLVTWSPTHQYDVVFALDVFECLTGRTNVGRGARHAAGAVRPGGILAVSACGYPATSRAAAWLRRWTLEQDAVVAYLDGRFGLRLVYRETHTADDPELAWYPEHAIAVYRKS
jgi:2-polyprenyl-3-methyl-5-hydroxy-6-metoxy-1,4-benzoquinol methylase